MAAAEVTTFARLERSIAEQSLSLTGSDVPLPILSKLPSDIEASTWDELKAVEYTNAHLPTLDDASISLWKSLHSFRPVRADYTAAFAQDADLSSVETIKRTFNWDSVQLPLELSGRFLGVVFRSKRRSGSESVNLYEADRKAHEEAVTSGGLLMYWYGVPDAQTGLNLATCIWTDANSARSASNLPLHRQAVKHAMRAYESFDLSRYSVVKHAGEARVRIEPWSFAAASVQ